MIKLLFDTTIAGYRQGAGAIINLSPALEAQLISEGDATPANLDVAHSYYYFHGFAGNQIAGDSKFFDLAAGNHGVRGANLSDATAFTTAGYIATANPGVATEDAGIHLPSLNFDYSGGEKLIVWWLMSAAVEAAAAIVMGDGWSTTTAQHGTRVRMNTDGKFDLSLWGATQGSSGSSHAAVFDGTLHSLAFCFDGSGRTHGMWSDEVFHTSFGSTYSSFGSGAAFDTLSANTWNIGGSRPASAASSAVGDGAAVKTRALAIIRLPASYSMPAVATLTSTFSQLRANPGKLLQASAF